MDKSREREREREGERERGAPLRNPTCSLWAFVSIETTLPSLAPEQTRRGEREREHERRERERERERETVWERALHSTLHCNLNKLSHATSPVVVHRASFAHSLQRERRADIAHGKQ